MSSPPSRDSVNVLFTSAGRRVELMRAFRRAYEDLNLRGSIVAVDADALAPTLQVADRRYVVPRLEDPSYLPCLETILRAEEIQLAFPLIDPDIPVLARNKARLESSGARLLVVGPEAAEKAADKWLTYSFFRSIGLPVPRTWLPGEARREKLEFPLIVKPRFGSAGRGAFRVGSQRELEFFLEYVPQPLVQEFLPGPEITSDVFCSAAGEVWAIVSRRRIEVRWGEVAKGCTVMDEQVLRGCELAARALKAVGPITVQCMARGPERLFTEINARFAGGMPLGLAAGVPSPHWYLAEAAGRPVVPPPLGTYHSGIYLTRFDDSFFLSEEEYARTGRHRI